MMRLASSRVTVLEAIDSLQTGVRDMASSIKFPLQAAAAATACAGGLLAVAKGYREAKVSSLLSPVILSPGAFVGRILLSQLATFLLPKVSDYVMRKKPQGVISAIAHPRRTIGDRFYRWLGLER